MGRAPCCDKANVKKGPWSAEEDAKLKEFIEKFGTGGNWIALPQKAGLKRCGKSCRLRWLNYLRPNIRHGEFSDDEDRIICSLYASMGSRWSVIAAQLPGRTDNDIKNYWNTKLKKKLLTVMPSVQEKQTFFPSMTFQPPPPPPYDHHTSDQFLNPSSAVIYTYTPNMIMSVNNTSINSLFFHDDHVNVTTNLQPPPLPPANNLTNHINIDVNDACYNYLGFQDDHHSMCNSLVQEYFQSASAMKEGMFMFGTSTNSSSESQHHHHHHHHPKQKYEIKKEDCQINNLDDDQVLGGQSQNYHSFMIKNHVSTPLFNDLEEVKPLSLINNYLLNDDGTNTTHYQKEMCYY